MWCRSNKVLYCISRVNLKTFPQLIDHQNPDLGTFDQYYYEVDDNIWRLDAIKSQQDEPDTSPGDQCLYPYKCWYKEYCESERKKTLI